MAQLSLSAQIAAVEAAIAKNQARLAELRTRKLNEIDTADIVAGIEVEYTYGRKENQKELTGKVLGVKEAGDKGAATVRIQFGEGVDTEVHGVFFSAIKRIIERDEFGNDLGAQAADDAALAGAAAE